MITNQGKQIISRYLLGQVPSYATHIAVGCGAIPLSQIDDAPPTIDLLAKEVLDFEMFRVPITSKGFVNQEYTFDISNKQLTSDVATLTTSVSHNIGIGDSVIITDVDSTFNGTYSVSGIPTNTTFNYSLTHANISSTAVSPVGTVSVSKTKVSLTAELPTSERYDITEIGLWSAPNNTLAINFDSRIMFDFSESWKGHGTSIYDPITNDNLGNSTTDIVDKGEVIFYALTADPLFQNSLRKARKEGARYLNTTLMMRGDASTITGSSGSWVGAGQHAHLNGISFDISRNNASDILKLGFSLVDKTDVGETLPNNVKILMQFYKNEVEQVATGYAKAEIEISGTEFATSRYHVIEIPISQLITSTEFSSPTIKICRIFTQVMSSSLTPSTNHYLAFDAFRVDNITTTNPLYKLSGYSIVRTEEGNPITKNENTNNYIDFRFNLGIV